MLEEYREQERERHALYQEGEVVLRQAVKEGGLPDELEDVLGGTQSKRKGGDRSNEPLVFLLTLRHGVRAVEARLAWCEEAIDALRAGKKKKAGRA